MSTTVSELSEAWKDYFEWKRHVREERRKSEDPDLFSSLEAAEVAAKSLLQDFQNDPNSSVVTIFITGGDNYKIDAISDHDEFELHRSEYKGEDVVALCFYRNGDPFIKPMR